MNCCYPARRACLDICDKTKFFERKEKKNMKKKLVALLLVLTMAICIFPASAFAEDENVGPIIPQYLDPDGYYHIYIKLDLYKVPQGTVLSYGSKYGHVYTAQMKLNEVSVKGNASCSVGTVDGDFGSKTRTGTYAFQNWFNRVHDSYGVSSIDVDGIIGNQTWNAFSKLMYLYN